MKVRSSIRPSEVVLSPDVWPRVNGRIVRLSVDEARTVSKTKTIVLSGTTMVSRQPIPFLFCVKTDSGRTDYYGVSGVRSVGNPRSAELFKSVGCGCWWKLVLVRASKQQFLGDSNKTVELPPLDKNLRIADFADTGVAKSILTQWLSTNGLPKFGGDYHEVSPFLSSRVIDECRHISTDCQAHPFHSEFTDILRVSLPASFSFVDLFAGIGGFRIAMQNLGGVCVFASEIAKEPAETYCNNFGVLPFGDITTEETKSRIPESFDVLCGGFPCQAFSQAGERKGFDDRKNRGLLYREVIDIADKHRPKAIFCENVRGLLSNAGGQTLSRILREVEEIGYTVVFCRILNSRDYGVPQNRERLYIVAVRNDLIREDVQFPEFPRSIRCSGPSTIGDIREPSPVPSRYYLGQSYWETLLRHRAKHSGESSGFGFRIKTNEMVAGTLLCGGMGRERNLLRDVPPMTPNEDLDKPKKGGYNEQNLRFMTVREWARLQGFPESFKLPSNVFSGYRQFGNSVTVPAVQSVAKAMLEYLSIIQCQDLK